MLSDIEVGQLPRSDGSASCSAYGCKVTAAVNGPLEVGRRDELPEEATVEVNVRPLNGVGSIRERHFESILHKVLRQVVRVQDHPRALIQITLQISSWEESNAWSGRSVQAASNLRAIPVLLNAAALALLATSIPLATACVAALVGVDADGAARSAGASGDLAGLASVHVFAFSLSGKLLLAESEGSFDLEAWERAVDEAKRVCVSVGDEQPMSDQSAMQDQIRAAVQANSALM